MASLFPQGMSWRSRRLWHPLGYAATALWMAFVLSLTHADTSHPLFGYLFLVPLAGWIAGVALAWLIGRIWPAESGSERERGERR